MEYSAENVLRLAKRWNNKKRSYLLVNPLQGKHIPASPTASWEMMRTLGRRMAGRWPGAKLVIGFAETATAVAAAAAGCFGEDCIYIHTTREEVAGVRQWVSFQEEHSHAVDQKLCGDYLAEWFRQTPQVVIIDDELSTGKTLLNIVESLRRQYPELAGKPVAAGSIINRLSPENTARLEDAGILCEYLVRPPEADYTAAVADYQISPAADLRTWDAARAAMAQVDVPWALQDPRTGVRIGRYIRSCSAMAGEVLAAVLDRLPDHSRILVLGTEECMFPALVLGKALERLELARSVAFHATTRSPIGICTQPGYPVTVGYKVHSFYSGERETYLYNLRQYDAAILLTDGMSQDATADIAKALYIHGCRKLLHVQGGSHVQFL